MIIMAFIICLLATMAGAVAGIGGGIIIKPIMDATTDIGASTISFLSGCTILMMAIVSTFCSRSDLKKLNLRRSTLLAAGAAIGGVCGKQIMQYIKAAFASDATLGGIQNIVLLILTVMVFLFMLRKDIIRKHHFTNSVIYLMTGTMLGIFSSFLGIGGGPINLAVLMYLFSMNSKEAAISSLYIILFSQAVSLFMSALTGSIPKVDTWMLTLMTLGGALGGLLGRKISVRLSGKGIDVLFSIMLIIIMCICCYNIYKHCGVNHQPSISKFQSVTSIFVIIYSIF